ncbi:MULTISPECIES: MFS transporter [unclassified Sphingomonas]|uniref:MFS transporter n=1 Tax=unclassified Sphingomonas TaxID=196159 RepID=UPI000BD7261D|nr:MAG: MFS transporter [Sphingomonas sp. 12-62-6]OYX40357.1 MAG: MFS transporter [Sphingomonas sp. 32-62-10]
MTLPKITDRDFALMFLVMLTIAAGNTGLQSILPALGRSLKVADSGVAAAFSVSALLWVIAAPYWAKRSDQHGRRAMILLGMVGFAVSLGLCGLFLMAGINGWISGTLAFLLFIGGRLIYGTFGAAAPPAVQALIAGRTTREERTKALTLLGSAFGLGTILGPAMAPYLILGWIGSVHIGLAGPALIFSVFGAAMVVTVYRMLPDDRGQPIEHAAAPNAYPSIAGQSSGASITAATAPSSEQVKFTDPRIRGWMIAGLVMGHAQTMTGQAIGFLVIDRLGLSPIDALQPTGLVLIMGAGAALLAQWGIIPILNLDPRRLMLVGLAIAAVGTVMTGIATSLYGIALSFALASLGFGFTRPGFTAGASLAVGAEGQGSVAGKVTSINGAAYVLGPSIGVGLYELFKPLPYVVAGFALALLFIVAWRQLKNSPDPGAEI